MTQAEELKNAYEAGMAAQRKIDEINRMLEEGTKQCPAMPSFESWLNREDLKKEKSHLKSQESSVVNERVISWEEAKQKVAENHQCLDWKHLIRYALHRSNLYDEDKLNLIIAYENEAAHLFMEANRQQSPEESIYEIDFAGHLKCQLKVNDGKIEIQGAMNGWGDGIPLGDISTVGQSLPKIPKEFKG